MTNRILVTGANGFVGRPLCEFLQGQGFVVRAGVRKVADSTSGLRAQEVVEIGDLGGEPRWDAAVNGMDVIVHLAARVHVMRDKAANPLAEFRRVNLNPTLELARAAVRCNVPRLVFVSSIKVNGEETHSRPFSDLDRPAPMDAYGRSKMEAEQGLTEISRSSGLEVVIVRPPLVYGPHVRGNFVRMLDWLYRGVPLPLAGATNRRSLIGVQNLVSALAAAVVHPKAAHQTFLVCDDEHLSTPELLRRVAAAMSRKARLVPVPARLLQLAASLCGQRETLRRLCGSLVVDSKKIQSMLGWTPSVSVDEQLRATARWYLEQREDLS
ncbi:MAG: SDR family oxidoreductase [Bryobacterales bacterium]|nr:SDR family oxidoreductase [Bryobacterales bacterium]